MVNLEMVQSATGLLLPKSEDAEPAIREFEAWSGIEVPPRKGDKLSFTSQGRTFWYVRGDDMAGYLEKFKRAEVAISSTESRIEFGNPAKTVYKRIGEPICRYSILAMPYMVEPIQQLLAQDPRYSQTVMGVPATFPGLLNQVASMRDLPIAALDVKISGSAEAIADLSGLGRVADRVETGKTAAANDLVEVYRLCDLYPEVLARRDNAAL